MVRLRLRRLLDVRKMLRVGSAVLRERPGQRRLLLLVGVALLLVVELDEHLAGAHLVAQVGVNLLDLAVGLGRDGHLVDRREGADHVDGAGDGGLLDDGYGDRLRLAVTVTGLGRVGFPAAGGGHGQGREHEESRRTYSQCNGTSTSRKWR